MDRVAFHVLTPTQHHKISNAYAKASFLELSPCKIQKDAKLVMLIALSGIGVLKGPVRKELALEGIIVISILKF